MGGRLRNLLLHPVVQASVVSTMAFAVYVRTLAPTVGWHDMGEFATAAYVLAIALKTGYPLFLLLGELFTLIPVGDIAHRANLMSSCVAALTVFALYLIVFRLSGRRDRNGDLPWAGASRSQARHLLHAGPSSSTRTKAGLCPGDGTSTSGGPLLGTMHVEDR